MPSKRHMGEDADEENCDKAIDSNRPDDKKRIKLSGEEKKVTNSSKKSSKKCRRHCRCRNRSQKANHSKRHLHKLHNKENQMEMEFEQQDDRLHLLKTFAVYPKKTGMLKKKRSRMGPKYTGQLGQGKFVPAVTQQILKNVNSNNWEDENNKRTFDSRILQLDDSIFEDEEDDDESYFTDSEELETNDFGNENLADTGIGSKVSNIRSVTVPEEVALNAAKVGALALKSALKSPRLCLSTSDRFSGQRFNTSADPSFISSSHAADTRVQKEEKTEKEQDDANNVEETESFETAVSDIRTRSQTRRNSVGSDEDNFITLTENHDTNINDSMRSSENYAGSLPSVTVVQDQNSVADILEILKRLHESHGIDISGLNDASIQTLIVVIPGDAFQTTLPPGVLPVGEIENSKKTAKTEKVKCPHCGRELSKRNLYRHVKNVHFKVNKWNY